MSIRNIVCLKKPFFKVFLFSNTILMLTHIQTPSKYAFQRAVLKTNLMAVMMNVVEVLFQQVSMLIPNLEKHKNKFMSCHDLN